MMDRVLHALCALLLGVLLCGAPAAALAQAHGADAGVAEPSASIPSGHTPEIAVTVHPEQGIKVGEVAQLEIAVTVIDGDHATLPEQGFAPFEKLGADEDPGRVADGQRTQRFTISLLAFEAGEFVLDDLTLRVVTKDGLVFSSAVPPVTIAVASLIGNEPNAELKPESAPVVVMEDDYTLAYVLAGVFAVLLIAGLTLLLQRYLAGRARPLPPPPPPRPPWEIASEELSALRARKQAMLDAGEAVEFVDRVSDVIRAYLGRCFHFAGLDTTTAELLDLLRQRSAPTGLQEESRDYLRRCDLVKFAKVVPDRDEVDLIFAKAQDIVQFSTPQQRRVEAPSDGDADGRGEA